MSEHAFNRALWDLFDAFQRKAPNDRQRELWYKKLSHLPNEAFGPIADWLIDQHDRMPSNIVREFKAGYRIWKEENKNRHPGLGESQKTPCEECGGTGYIYFRAFLKAYGYTYNFTAICGRCENWRVDLGSIDGMLRTTQDGAEKWAMDERWLAYMQGLTIQDLRRHEGVSRKAPGNHAGGNVEARINTLPWEKMGEERGEG